MIVVGEPVALPGVPEGLVARARVETRDAGGEQAARRDRRGRLRLRHGVALVAAAPDQPRADELEPTLAALAARGAGDPERLRALLLDAARRSRSTVGDRLGDAADEVGVVLARHGWLRLIAEVAADGSLQPWHRWEHTPALTAVAEQRARDRDHRRHRRAAATDRLADQARRRGRARVGDRLARLALPEADATSELARIERLLAALPADQAPLSVLAREITGDTHGLDADRPTGRRAAELAAALAVDVGAHDRLVDPTDAAGWRSVWAAVGVAADALSCSALTSRLPATAGATGAAAISRSASATGEPTWLTLRALQRAGGGWRRPRAGERVHLVEGTALVELAASEGLDVPIVCHGGVPNSAVLELCAQLVAAGWRLAVSADMEPTPLSAVGGLLRRFPGAAAPWRLTAHDLRGADRSGPPFAPERVPDTPWDPGLAAALRADPRRATEEDRIETLLGDLRAAAHGS